MCYFFPPKQPTGVLTSNFILYMDWGTNPRFFLYCGKISPFGGGGKDPTTSTKDFLEKNGLYSPDFNFKKIKSPDFYIRL
jgi:hypothetical protein